MKIWTKEQRMMLGLNDKEGILLDVLFKNDVLNTSALAYRASLPRITALRIAKSLHARGFLSRKETRHEVFWSIVDPRIIEKQFAQLFHRDTAHRLRNIELSEVGHLTIYRGEEEMIESNRKMLFAHAGERVLAIEPNGIWKHFAKIQSKEVYELNVLWKKKNILVEMITEEGFADVVKTHVGTDIESSFLSLVVDTWTVPKGILDSATEILIFRDQVLFSDWEHLVGVEIKNPSTVRVIKAMYRMMQKNGKPFQK